MLNKKHIMVLKQIPLLLCNKRFYRLSLTKHIASLGSQHENKFSYHIPVSLRIAHTKGSIITVTVSTILMNVKDFIQRIKLFYFRFIIAVNTNRLIQIITLIILSIIFRIYFFHVCYADDNSVYAINGSRAISQYNLENRMGTQVVPPATPMFSRPPSQWYSPVSSFEANKHYQEHCYKLAHDPTYRVNYQRYKDHFYFGDRTVSANPPLNPSNPAVPSLPEAITTIPVDSISARISQAIDDFWDDRDAVPPVPFNANLFIRNFDFHSFYNNFCNNYNTFNTQVRSAIFMIEFMKQHLPSDILPKTLAEFNGLDTNKPFNRFLNGLFDSLEPLTNEDNVLRYTTLQTAIDTYVKLHISGKLNNTILFGQTFEKDFLNNLKNARKLFKI